MFLQKSVSNLSLSRLILVLSGEGSFVENQWVIPYFYGGISSILLTETRDDKTLFESHFAYSFAAVGSGGIMINLGRMDPYSLADLSRNYGIHNLWLTAEYRVQYGLLENLDMTVNSINVGATVDF